MTEIRWPQRPAPFWNRFVAVGECLEWTGTRDKDGYGVINQYNDGNPRPVRISRLIYEKLKGPLNGRLVRHSCDNPPCGQPEHLLAGTPLDNMRDKVERGRWANGSTYHPERALKGSQVGTARLTEDAVLEIRRLRSAGKTQSAVAVLFGVSKGAIKDIDHRRTWAWLP